MTNLWQKLTYHKGNGWWNLPQTASQESDPPHEGPIGGAWLGNIWRVVTNGGVAHAGPGFYWLVGFLLAVITLAEVWAFTLEGLGPWYVPLLLILSLFKFVGVVAFFMQLRFDHRLFSYLFVAAMMIVIGIFTSLLLLSEYAYLSP